MQLPLSPLLPTLLLLLHAPAVLSALNGPCSGIATGACVSSGTCGSWGGSWVAGYCPNDPSGVRCCVVEGCSGASSFCGWPGDCAGGTLLSGEFVGFWSWGSVLVLRILSAAYIELVTCVMYLRGGCKRVESSIVAGTKFLSVTSYGDGFQYQFNMTSVKRTGKNGQADGLDSRRQYAAEIGPNSGYKKSGVSAFEDVSLVMQSPWDLYPEHQALVV
ncbi:hypothetical protein B0H34DRAFT_679738 [Crassisporium funariophilum]|nr:hypothetical protein B0H34DRAFT_679738 [Crassisporium funariophilum]